MCCACKMTVFFFLINVGGAIHFIYYINRLTTTKVDSTYLGCLTSNTLAAYKSVAGLELMTSGSTVSALSYRALSSFITCIRSMFHFIVLIINSC